MHSNIDVTVREGYFYYSCPDKGYKNFQRYIAFGVTAYNLKRIGKQLLTQDSVKKLKKPDFLRIGLSL